MHIVKVVVGGVGVAHELDAVPVQEWDRDQNTVYSVQHSAVGSKNRSSVLLIRTPFYKAFDEVAQHRENADDKA